MSKGKFIVFEGIDGSGTTTQASLLYKRLQESGIASVLTCEPTDGAVGALIREALKKDSSVKLEPDTLALLFAADRIEHYRKKILPALERGEIVVSDRYVYSSLSYQPIFSDREFIERINSHAPFADVCFLLEIPVETGLDRISSASRGGELFEKRDILTKVSENYKLIAATNDRANICKVNGSLAIAEIESYVLKKLNELFELVL